MSDTKEFDRRVRMTATAAHEAHSKDEPSPTCDKCWYDWPLATEETRKAWRKVMYAND